MRDGLSGIYLPASGAGAISARGMHELYVSPLMARGDIVETLAHEMVHANRRFRGLPTDHEYNYNQDLGVFVDVSDVAEPIQRAVEEAKVNHGQQ